MTTIPYRLSENTFRKFEHVIAMAVRHYPNTIPLDPQGTGYTANTYAARLRDAIASYKQFHWASTVLDYKRFLEVQEDLQVSQATNPMRIGSRAKLKEPHVVGPIQINFGTVETIILTSAKEQVLLCTLAARRLLTQPIPVLGITDTDSAWLQDNFDVTITKTNQNTYLIE